MNVNFTTATDTIDILKEAMAYVRAWGHTVKELDNRDLFIHYAGCQCEQVDAFGLIRIAGEIWQNEN